MNVDYQNSLRTATGQPTSVTTKPVTTKPVATKPVTTNLVIIGSDHGGFQLKQQLVTWLAQQGVAVEDVGAQELDPDDDYPVFAQRVGQRLTQRKGMSSPSDSSSGSSIAPPPTWGVLLCRTGAGMTIVANRFPAVRAVVCRNVVDAQLARAHNNANVVVLEGDHLTLPPAQDILTAFFQTPFEGGRHARRLEQLDHFHPQLDHLHPQSHPQPNQ